jgi:hypothetical protein
MSVVQFAGAGVSSRLAPPIEVTKQLHKKIGVPPPRGSALEARGMLLHLLFGAAAGALYGMFAPRRYRRATGGVYALGIYGASYAGYLPALSLHPHVADDHWARQVGNLLAHVVYGVALAEVMRVTGRGDD